MSPSVITVCGILFSVFAALSFGRGSFRLAGLWCVLAGLCDMTDGAVARASGRVSPQGAFLDSVSDRYAEVVMLFGLMWFYAVKTPSPAALIGVYVALSGSLLVSYAKARAEGLGEECTIGVMERPERMVVIIVAAFLGTWIMVPALWFLGITAHLTAAQRTKYVSDILRGRSETSTKGV